METVLAGLMNRSGADGFWRLCNFCADATDETKILHDEICSLIWSDNFSLVRWCGKGLSGHMTINLLTEFQGL